jgi:CRISPR/Cas system-associated protein endoribonuclease Cas2
MVKSMRIIEALYSRKSVRNYVDQIVDDSVINKIRRRIENIEPLYKNEKVDIFISDYCKKSFYAPYYIGAYTSGTKEGKINAGYVMQQLSVYLTSIGLGSCFQAKNVVFREENTNGNILTLSMAFGYPNGELCRDEEDIRRLNLNKICVFKENANKEVEYLLNIARIAPSSYNTQPWRMVVYNNRIHIFAKRRKLLYIDKYTYVNIGIILGNISLGAEEAWIDINYKEVKNISYKDYGDNEYIISIYNE